MKRIGLLFGFLILITGLSLLPLFAQDTSDDTARLMQERLVTLHPLEEVTKTAATIQDITSDSARLNFVGTIPLACTVVFGTTTTFGNASVDQNMNGGAIIEHNPLLLN